LQYQCGFDDVDIDQLHGVLRLFLFVGSAETEHGFKKELCVFQGVGVVDLADDLVENGYKIVIHMAAPFRIGGFGSQHLDKWRGILVGFFTRGRLKYLIVPHRQLIVEFAQLGGFVFILILADMFGSISGSVAENINFQLVQFDLIQFHYFALSR
jgi:hypothetical protein